MINRELIKALYINETHILDGNKDCIPRLTDMYTGAKLYPNPVEISEHRVNFILMYVVNK